MIYMSGIDINKVKEFFGNKKIFNVYSAMTILILFTICFNIFIRMEPERISISDSWASNAVDTNIKNQITQQVSNEYPNLPEYKVTELVNQRFNDVISKNKEGYEQQIKTTSDYFKGQLKDSNGVTYIGSIDPYYYLRQTENLIKNGNYYDVLVNGAEWDNKMFYPIGEKTKPNLINQFGLISYKICQIFNPNVSIPFAFSLVPIIIAILSIIPAFFIVYKKTNLLGGFIAGMMIGLHPIFLSRSMFGFSDTDGFVVLFALFAVWFYFLAQENSIWWKYSLFAGLAGITIGIFSFAWEGWFYIFDVIIAYTIIYIGYTEIKRFLMNDVNSSMKYYIILLVFILFSALCVEMIDNYHISDAISQPLARIKTLDSAALSNYWPNIQTTVAELNPIDISGTINQIGYSIIGGRLLYWLSLLGIFGTLLLGYIFDKEYMIGVGIVSGYLLLLMNNLVMGLPVLIYLMLLVAPVAFILIWNIKKDIINVRYIILLMIWYAGGILASSRGVRFILLMVPVFAIGIGLFIGYLYNNLDYYTNKNKKGKSLFTSRVGLVAILCLILFLPISASQSVTKQSIPMMNDAWYNSLNKIKIESPQNSVLNSWWDYGHWFKYYAERPVTVDGAGQDYQLAYWMGSVLVSNNESTAISTLEMLDCYSKSYFKNVDTGDTIQTIDNIKKSLIKDEITCDNLPTNYLITSNDMVGKAGVWAHFGLWDFKKSYLSVTAKNGDKVNFNIKAKEYLNISGLEADNLYTDLQYMNRDQANAWIAPWPQYYTSGWVSCPNGLCPIGFTFNYNGQSYQINGIRIDNNTVKPIIYDKEGKLVNGNFHATLFLGNESINKTINTDGILNIDITLDGNRILLSDPNLSEALFTQLYFYDGKYVKGFEKFDEQSSAFGDRIVVWKVKW